MLRELLRPSFPPYQLGTQDYIQRAQEKFARLEKLYYIGQNKNWNGKEVLAELLQKHGGIQIDERMRKPLARIFAIILWGELAAWIISADLAERLEDIEAKMAATGQAFDEARHFTTMRDYLIELGGEVPQLDFYSSYLLRIVIDTPVLLHKLLGMQLLIETIAVDLFRTVAEKRLEPVLADLLPFFERDESRHVGLGVMYIPTLLDGLSIFGLGRLQAFQAQIFTFLSMTMALLYRDFEQLGIDNNLVARRGIRLQLDALEQMASTRGILSTQTLGEWGEWLFAQGMDYLFPPEFQKRAPVAELLLGSGNALARAGNYALGWLS